jgi:hypothetical protein
VGLKTHTTQKYRHPVCIGILHLALKNTVELLKPAVVDYHFIAGFELIRRFYKSVFSDSRSNETNDLLVDGRRPVVETY